MGSESSGARTLSVPVPVPDVLRQRPRPVAEDSDGGPGQRSFLRPHGHLRDRTALWSWIQAGMNFAAGSDLQVTAEQVIRAAEHRR